VFYSVADLYIILYDTIVSNPEIGHGREGFYFGENGEYTLYEASKAVSEAMLAHGKGNALEPSAFTEEEYEKMPLVNMFVSLVAHQVTDRICHFSRAGHLLRHKLPLSCGSVSIYWLEASQDHKGHVGEH